MRPKKRPLEPQSNKELTAMSITSPARPVIETHGLCKRYGAQMSVDHLDPAVPAGSVYGFIGPNGAGKSTTMKMLLGLIHPTAGQVLLLGKPMNTKQWLALLHKTGFLYISPEGYSHLNILDTLANLTDL